MLEIIIKGMVYIWIIVSFIFMGYFILSQMTIDKGE